MKFFGPDPPVRVNTQHKIRYEITIRKQTYFYIR